MEEATPASGSAINRRRFLGLSLGGAVGAGVFANMSPALRTAAFAAPRGQGRGGRLDWPFTLGVASGDPTSSSVVLWTRLAPDPLDPESAPGRQVAVRWELASDDRFRKVVKRGVEHPRPDSAHSVHANVDGLDPDRWYWYRFAAGPHESQVGRTRTMPSPGARADSLKFAFASCQMYEHGYYTAYRHMANEDLDMVIHLGDYIYEYGPNVYRVASGNVRFHDGPEVFSLASYRNRHALYRTDPDLQAAHANFPFVVTWDDHEVDNNYADEIPERNHDPKAFVQRRANAYQAFYEHMPLRPESRPSGPDMPLHRRISFGSLATFNVLDTRQYRSDQACGDGRRRPCPEMYDANRTLTGEGQEDWLFAGLAGSAATWNVIPQQVFVSRRDLRAGRGEEYSMDAWDGYPAARQRLVGAIRDTKVRNPVFLTGDVHSNWAADLTSDPNDPSTPPIAAEFVGTSITSGGDGVDTTAGRQATVAENPNIHFSNGQRGYVRCHLTPEVWRADFQVLSYVSRPGAPVTTRASFVVQDGRPGTVPA